MISLAALCKVFAMRFTLNIRHNSKNISHCSHV